MITLTPKRPLIRRCARCGLPTLGEYCSPGCVVAAMTEQRIEYFFPESEHEEVRKSAKAMERT